MHLPIVLLIARHTNREADSVYITHTTCMMNTEEVDAIATCATGAMKLIAKAKAVAQDDNRDAVSMKKKNFPTSGSNPTAQHCEYKVALYSHVVQ